MTVMILERVPASLRGELSRWLLEPKTGVFVGRIPASVRQRLWQRACQGAAGGACLLVYAADTEQGFRIDFWGRTSRAVEDFDGLQLIRIPFEDLSEEVP